MNDILQVAQIKMLTSSFGWSSIFFFFHLQSSGVRDDDARLLKYSHSFTKSYQSHKKHFSIRPNPVHNLGIIL